MKNLLNLFKKDTVVEVGKVVDSLITSDNEKLKAKAELTKIVTDSLSSLHNAQRDVLVKEMEGSKLQRNWRPITMLSFVGIVVSTYFVLPILNIKLQNPDITSFIQDLKTNDNFWTLLELGLGGYVIGRSLEKITGKVTDNVDLTFLKKKDRKDKVQ